MTALVGLSTLITFAGVHCGRCTLPEFLPDRFAVVMTRRRWSSVGSPVYAIGLWGHQAHPGPCKVTSHMTGLSTKGSRRAKRRDSEGSLRFCVSSGRKSRSKVFAERAPAHLENHSLGGDGHSSSDIGDLRTIHPHSALLNLPVGVTGRMRRDRQPSRRLREPWTLRRTSISSPAVCQQRISPRVNLRLKRAGRCVGARRQNESPRRSAWPDRSSPASDAGRRYPRVPAARRPPAPARSVNSR